jgi:hypothetical protein
VNDAAKKSCQIIETVLGGSHAFRKVGKSLYVVRQGSAYVTVEVLSGRKGTTVVRFVAPLAHGVRLTRELAVALLTMNAQLRFGAFGYVPAGRAVLLTHSVLGGETLDPEEILWTLRDVALLADEYDDKIVKAGGGMRMQDMIEDEALANITKTLEDRKADKN